MRLASDCWHPTPARASRSAFASFRLLISRRRSFSVDRDFMPDDEQRDDLTVPVDAINNVVDRAGSVDCWETQTENGIR